MSPLIWPMRSLANGLGLAWWAKVHTRNPSVTYWFGPYVRRSGLEKALPGFLADLESESPDSIEQSLIRCRRTEPFTIESAS
ncbi:DUF1816 domain-containing protein [Synechococcus sp. W2B2]|jgi:hypothetical protein|uniref:DUF1816 domain-containing protein n=1 Tax=unclassified Synechococcus TaxID=2626047 RepID=UPI0002EC510F|nr:DUF1816 domain-containing protein [Synechococcus sp. WH 7805]